MAANLAIHPTAETLQGFGLGKLDDAKAQVVLRHLDSCPDCRKVVSSISGDSFLDRLKGAHAQSNQAASNKSLPTSSKSVPGATTLPPVSNLPAELANHQQYQVMRELGKGGMGVVYLAKNVLMDRLEVLKVVNKALLDKPGAAERFLREIRAAAKLSHDHVVKAYSALALGESLVFAMEYVEGEDLAQVIERQGPLAVANASFYVYQAARGLHHAHEHGMVHRDIKPHNLILSRQGKMHQVKILDFGLAKATRAGNEDSGLTGAGRMLGTPDYIAPEQTLDAASADIRADIYSLGCTLYFLLTGSPPFKGKSLFEILQAHISMDAVSLDQVRAEVPAELAAVVAKMMAKDPAQRYQEPIEVARALAPFVKAAAKAAPTAEATKSMPPASSGIKSAGKSVSPEKAAPVRWETIVEGSATTSAGRKRAAALATRRVGAKRWPVVVGVGVALLLLGLVGLVAIVLHLRTADGSILEIEVNEPNADVFVDGEKVTVTWDNGGKKAEIRVQPGRKVEVKKDGFTVTGGEVQIKDGQRHVLTAKLSQITPPVALGNQKSPTEKGGQKENTLTEKGEKKTPSGKGEDKTLPDKEGQQPWKNDEDPLIAGMKFVRVPKGTFWMSKNDMHAQAQVKIEQDFELAAYTVTQAQWEAVMGHNPSSFSRQGKSQDRVQNVSDADLKQLPVESVSWEDVQDFIVKLNEQRKGRGWTYRLPSEAEWEYACRGAATSKEECSFDFYFGQPTNDVSSKDANFIGKGTAGNADKGPWLGRPTKVGSYAPNKLGLYDMHGNVWQWCADFLDAGSNRALRGGGWVSYGRTCRATNRYARAPTFKVSDLGFRLARVPSWTQWKAVAKKDTPGKPDEAGKSVESKLYLRDLKEFDCVVHDRPERFPDGINGIAVKGERFKKGLWMHPSPNSDASVKYRLDGLDAFVFEAKVAINDTAPGGSKTPVKFQVFGDGKALWTSKPLQATRQTEDCTVNVEGIHVLELRVVCPGPISSAHAVWLDPYLLSKKPTTATKRDLPKTVTVDAESPLVAAMKFVRVPKGTFWMGGGGGKPGNNQVAIKDDFELAAYPVTQEQWEAVMGNNLSFFSRQGGGKVKVQEISDADLKRFPVEMVSWDDAQEFIKKLNEQQKGTGWTYRLPSEPEWEYACRGAATSKEDCSFDFYFDQPTNDLSSTQANFNGNNPAGKAGKGPWLNRPTKVGSYAPNKLGLYDMHGNTLQWCADFFDAGRRVFRGGGWNHHAAWCRAAQRFRLAPDYRGNDLGFRLARVPSGTQ
jgi:formylglycine-generating enzyme required for sulfatase activity/serine/threonine protein kinase